MGGSSLTHWPVEVLSHADSAMAVPALFPALLGLALQQGGLEAPKAQLQPAPGPQLQNHFLLRQQGSRVPSEPTQAPPHSLDTACGWTLGRGKGYLPSPAASPSDMPS